ncbi:hypothetical protein RGQ29_016303 [Quercus rubra]|uniref:Cytochrome P450 n=1 Tax=Quercus rubra TaxID=3512 RepID=A0AAN7FJ99_QUERU|nr:hypothetical protein RGQ29_016303 [Quercus rubra]
MTDSQYYLVCFLLSTLLFHFIFNKLLKLKTHPKLPPSPPALPVIGHLHLLSSTFYKSLQKLSTQYGPIFNLRLVGTEIFKTHDLSFADHQEIAFSEKTPYGNSGFFSAPYGDYWRFIKKLCTTELLSTRQLERSRAAREKELARFLQNVFESAKRKEVVDLGVELMKLTNNMLCKMAASTSCSEKDDEAERIRETMKDPFKVGSKIFFGNMLGPFGFLAFWLFGKQVISIQLRIDELLERMLKEHEDQIGKKDTQNFMDILLKVYQDDKAEVKMTRNNIKAFLTFSLNETVDIQFSRKQLWVFWKFCFVFLNTGTSSEVILWTIIELINHPSVFNKVRKEINSVVGSFEVPEETMVLINLYAIMRDPDLWNNPNEFQPERFLVSSEKQESMKYKHDKTFSFLPFGARRRACPSSKLGLSMAHMAIATMVQCFNWEVAVGDGGENKVEVNIEV